jgi:hypothetical protein
MSCQESKWAHPKTGDNIMSIKTKAIVAVTLLIGTASLASASLPINPTMDEFEGSVRTQSQALDAFATAPAFGARDATGMQARVKSFTAEEKRWFDWQTRDAH